jgi:CRISPR-associated protein Cmr6
MRDKIKHLAERNVEGHHPGLLLQRYLDTPIDPDKRKYLVDERKKLLCAAIEAAKSGPCIDLYKAAYERWDEAFPRDGWHRSAELATARRLAVGLGAANMLEVGLRLHHTYGTPVIPGSALKGLTSHYCHDVWGQRGDESAPQDNRLFRRGESHHRLLFGTTDDGGVITFHDAWITPRSLREGALRLDVMTPHHLKWQTNAALPTDFDGPVPVSFLSVAGSFAVRLSWSGPATTPPDRIDAWTALAMRLLCEALKDWGGGGKTRSGYGRLVSLNAHPAPTANLPATNEVVEARLLEERSKKGKRQAQHEPTGLSGAIVNSEDVPPDKEAGATLKLIVTFANPREIGFRYQGENPPEPQPRASGKGKGKGKGMTKRGGPKSTGWR